MLNAAIYHRPVARQAVPFFQILFGAALCVLIYQSVIPTRGGVSFDHYDKVLHAGAYAVLTGLMALAFPRLRLFYLFLLPTLLGGCLEIAQASLPFGRTGSIWDLLANVFGTLIIVFSIWSLAKIFQKWRNNRLG